MPPRDLNLAFAVSTYFEHGGMQRNMLRIAKECVRRGYQVDLFAGEWRGAEIAEPGVRVRNLAVNAATNHGVTTEMAKRLRGQIASAPYRCVVGFNRMPGLDLYYAGDPCYAERFYSSKPRWLRWLPRYRAYLNQERAVFRKGASTGILLSAHQEKEKFIRHYQTEPNRFHLLPPGLDRDRLKEPDDRPALRASTRNRLGMPESDFLILMVGSGFATKGVDRSIHALAALPPALRSRCRLLIVGQGKQQPFERLANQLGVAGRVQFVGADSNVRPFYCAADLLMHPSYSENTGNVLLEAMYCGLPVLTTANCGFAFHVRTARAGKVVPMPFEQSALNAALEEMAVSPQLDACAKKGMHYCQTHDLFGLVDRAADVIEQHARRG